MLKIINKYKLGIIGFSIVLSGCSTTDYLKFKAECAKLPDNYINNSLTPEYEKEKSFSVIEKNSSACAFSQRCTILETNDRWDFVEIYLVHREGLFPETDGFYKMYRDYKFSNCLSNYRGPYGNSYENKKGSFCIAGLKILKPISSIKLSYKYNIVRNKNSSVNFITNEVFYKKNLYIKENHLIFNSPMSNSRCEKEKNTSNLITEYFN